LKCTQILDEIEEEENSKSKLEFFLTRPQSPSEAKSKNARYDRRCNEEHNRCRSAQFLTTHEKTVTNLLNPVRGWRSVAPMSTTMEPKKIGMHCGEKIRTIATSTTLRGNSKDAQTLVGTHHPKGKC